MAEAIHLYQIVVSNQGLDDEINKLEAQMKTLQPGTPEYEYDQLQLSSEEREREIREENPNLDPSTPDGARALEQIMEQDPKLQEINREIRALINAHPYECTSWGIPMADPRYTKAYEVQ